MKKMLDKKHVSDDVNNNASMDDLYNENRKRKAMSAGEHWAGNDKAKIFCKAESSVKMDSTDRKEWTRDRNKKQFRQINDIVHEHINVYYPLHKLIDTPEFQRLRYVKQLGVSYLTYPTADHSRFTHSLGVYALANSFVKELAEVQPALQISSHDQLCVCIAALLHDLGHGPFSHLYESFVGSMNKDLPTFKHEEMSKRLFRRMLKTNAELKKSLDEFLNESDYLFIEELIDPPTPFVKNGVWQLKGRPIEKSFLYDFVSNKHNGMDVDKFDYFLRDSHNGLLPIPFSMNTVGRIREATRALFDKELGFRRLTFSEKNICEIRNMFESRVMLFDRLYYHKTTVACETMMKDILAAADEHLRFSGDDGRDYRLSSAYLDEGAFLSLDDRVLYLIRLSTDSGMAKARETLRNLEERKLLRFIHSAILDNFENKMFTEDEVRGRIAELCKHLRSEQIFVEIRCNHRGLGMMKRPIELVPIYDKRSIGDQQLKEITQVWCKYNAMPLGGKAIAFIYAPYGTDDATLQRLKAAAIRFERRCGGENDDEEENSSGVQSENDGVDG